MMQEYDRVRLIRTGKTGIIVDMRVTSNHFYLVEMDDDNELVDCTEADIEPLQEDHSIIGEK